ncbi:MAG: urea ABC transporter permease subunit UrtB [Eubacterium sp.]|nr:urea ABC transporter permease subunit UrtB [Eubacterium sp.]
MSTIITTMFNGLSLSSIILLASIGLIITFGLMKVINMAHGEFLMIGAYVTYLVQLFFQNFLPAAVFDLYYPVALVVSFAVTFLLGCVLEKLVISHLYGREVDSLLATWGISLILMQLARTLFGTQGVNVQAPGFLTGGLSIGSVTFSYNRIFIICLVIASLIIVSAVLNKSSFGKQMRAVIDNRPIAQSMGINSRRIDCLTFGFGSALAGLAGCSLALLGSIDSHLGQNYIVQCFITVVLGGVGNLAGVVIGSLIVGFSTIWVQFYTSSNIANAIVMVIIIAFLQVKPEGIFSRKSRALDD